MAPDTPIFGTKLSSPDLNIPVYSGMYNVYSTVRRGRGGEEGEGGEEGGGVLISWSCAIIAVPSF